ncbi:MAG: DNA cytosine methyltransferase [Miltoncostaeaceae bacterium]
MRCIELFAGAGGAALGLEAAGIEHAALCEWDRHACATLRAAGLGPVVEGDVRDLDAIAAVAGESCGLLWSSFPCQAWSRAGKQRGAEDERNGWPWTVDAIDRFSPRWFLAENVRGLIQHSEEGHPDPQKCPRCYFETVILAQLRERFACVGWWVLNAADFGVPQMRHRVIIWAGPKPIRAPRPTHGPPEKARQGDLFGPGVSPWVAPWWYSRPSPCVCATDYAGHTNPHKDRGRAGGINRSSDGWFLSQGGNRIPIDEALAVQGFPTGYPLQGGVIAQFRQVGNAVPPKLAEVVGRALMAAEGAA